MAKTMLGKSASAAAGDFFSQRTREIGAIALIAAGLYLLVSLASYRPDDPSWANTVPFGDARNLGGGIGAWLAHALFFVCGGLAYLFPLALGDAAARLALRGRRGRPGSRRAALRAVGLMLLLFGLCGLASIHFQGGALPASAGGALGQVTADSFVAVFGLLGATLLLCALCAVGLPLASEWSWLQIADAAGALTLAAGRRLARLCESLRRLPQRLRARRAAVEARGERRFSVSRYREKLAKPRRERTRIEPAIKTVAPGPKAARERREEQQMPMFAEDKKGKRGARKPPPLSKLREAVEKDDKMSADSLKSLAKLLEVKLADFGIEAEVTAARVGPVIIRFELTPAPGVKASRITNLEKDLARALSVTSVRVVEIIPGKSVVGLEVPRENRLQVSLKEILSSADYERAPSPLTLALGKDISGEPVMADLAKMPHLLVAGTTGAGKSVGLHAMLLSVLFKAPPEQVRLILIDPKMLELNMYAGIPHLLTPVITDVKLAAQGLHWAVAEMDRRYRLMSEAGVRNLAGYNRKLKESPPPPAADGDEDAPPAEPLPYVVIVVDEFADMIMTVGKRVEELIARLAQKARAAGIHLILATQRPSVDVITGLIKANVPARIAFQVSSKTDSRTIIDQNGAEQLLGQGDMLYLAPGSAVPERVHGAFVSDAEVSEVTDYLRAQGAPAYIEVERASEAPGGDGGDEQDPLYAEALEIVVKTRKASISGLQRRLKIGYNRAARLIEDMEAAGVVGEVGANGMREVIAAPPEA